MKIMVVRSYEKYVELDLGDNPSEALVKEAVERINWDDYKLIPMDVVGLYSKTDNRVYESS